MAYQKSYYQVWLLEAKKEAGLLLQEDKANEMLFGRNEDFSLVTEQWSVADGVLVASNSKPNDQGNWVGSTCCELHLISAPVRLSEQDGK